MREPEIDTLLFFDEHLNAVPLYLYFEEALYSIFPDVNRRVQKTQITFSNQHVFACVSFARVKKKAELPDPYIVITLGLPYPLESDRVAIKTEPYCGIYYIICEDHSTYGLSCEFQFVKPGRKQC